MVGILLSVHFLTHSKDLVVDRVAGVIGSREIAKQLRIVQQLGITDRLVAGRRTLAVAHNYKLSELAGSTVQYQ